MGARASLRTDAGWRDTLTAATDLALLGIVTTVAALPVVTAGAAIASASVAVREWTGNERLPSLTEGLVRLRRGLWPGLAASLVGAVATGLLLLNASALARGAVPGGTPLLVATGAVVLLWAGFAGLTIVEVGGGDGWVAAARSAWRTSVARPWVPFALGLVVAIAVFLGLVLPFLAPVLIGYALFALHISARRLRAARSVDLG
jgi:hypothetical protein